MANPTPNSSPNLLDGDPPPTPAMAAERGGGDGDDSGAAAAASNAKNLSASRVICHAILNAVNKPASQIKKPLRRRSVSPLNWFPRKKTVSLLNRKIKILQENGGMKSSLGEILGDSNPHYCRIVREKMAAREAAQKAMEARKAAMVEASWCRILKASRLPTKEAEFFLELAEKNVEKAFEEATEMGIIMYDKPGCPRRPYEVETSPTTGGQALHTVTASFETEFEVDKEVSAAVKTAFLRLAKDCCSEKEEFNDIVRKISQNPELNETLSEMSSPAIETDSDAPLSSPANLVMMMLTRLKCLKDEEIASIATTVATCGLNAVLQGADSCKRYDYGLSASSLPHVRMKKLQAGTDLPSLDKFLVKRVSRLEKEVPSALPYGQMKKLQEGTDLPSLDKFLVKHVSRLEKEVQEAKAAKERTEIVKNAHKEVPIGIDLIDSNRSASELPGLDKYLVKHFSKLEREIQKSKTKKTDYVIEENENKGTVGQPNLVDREEAIGIMENGSDVDKMKAVRSEENMAAAKRLVSTFDGQQVICKENVDVDVLDSQYTNSAASKPLSRVERSKQEALEAFSGQQSLGTLLTKHICRLEKEKTAAKAENAASTELPSTANEMKYLKTTKESVAGVAESLDKVIVKHVSRLEKKKTAAKSSWEEVVKKEKTGYLSDNTIGLGEVLVKHESKLEKVKQQQPTAQLQEEGANQFESRRKARERELMEAWGGLSLGNSVKPHLSRLERDKAAWKRAEEEERRRARKV